MPGRITLFTLTKDKKLENTCDERTPLLNGSGTQNSAGPCFFRETDQSGQSGVSTPESDQESGSNGHSPKFYFNVCKIVLLMVVMIFAVSALSFIKEKTDKWIPFTVIQGSPAHINVSEYMDIYALVLSVKAQGAFLPQKFVNFSEHHVFFSLVPLHPTNSSMKDIDLVWTVPVAPTGYADDVGVTTVEHTFTLPHIDRSNHRLYQLEVSTDEDELYLSVAVTISLHPSLRTDSVVMATCVLIGLYILIIFELVHRTLAAMIGATTAIAFLALVGERPSLETVLSWLDVETLCLLFGMMILVAILCETGFFDYTAVLAYRLARGRLWPLITTLCVFTAVLSAFLDNVTTILLTTAITIRLCEVMNLDPKHVLIALVLFSNIGGAATPVGDPPNVIIISDETVQASGVNFASFTLHALPNILLCLFACFAMLRFMYRDVASLRFSDPSEVVELRHEIDVWKKACQSLSGYSRDEDTVRGILQRKVMVLENLLRKKLYDVRPSEEDYRQSLKELTTRYKIRNKPLLIKCGVVIFCVIVLFFLQSVPQLNLSLGWIAILGAIILLILADFDEIEGILNRVEWSTLLFFAALFVVMESLSQLQLLWYIGQTAQEWIIAVPEDNRLLVAIIIVLWVSALASSFIDNIPFTTVMVQIVSDIASNQELNLPVTPLVYALAFGACLGGNGTLIGASANVVCAGLAEQHGYRFSFMDFFRVGFPVMLVTTLISTAYLLVCHIAFQWGN